VRMEGLRKRKIEWRGEEEAELERMEGLRRR
jgi:hypothetical protein